MKLISIFFATLIVSALEAQKVHVVHKFAERLTRQAQFKDDDIYALKFLTKNIQYPQMERDLEIRVKVCVRFMVDENGAIQDISILKGFTKATDKEVVRAIKLMPKWQPAMYKKKPVRVYYILPVEFKMQT